VASDVAVLFDLDGVLVDSREQHMAAWDEWSRDYAPHAPEGYFIRSFGLRNDAIIGGLLADIDASDLRRLADAKERLFRDHVRRGIEALSGARELLDALDARRIRKAVVTSTPRENLDLVLDALGFAGRFDTLVAEEDASKGKPDPEGFLVAASRLGITPDRCVVIEDAPHGLRAAKAGGMRAIGVTTTHEASELLDADVVVGSLADAAVLAFLLG
jgi:HAD superfamily hydrolase (TIGR01509 family)